jgi:hypothetical protein
LLNIGSPQLEHPTIQPVDANENTIQLIGILKTPFTINAVTKISSIPVSKKPLDLLGRDILNQFDLMDKSINQICKKISSIEDVAIFKDQLKTFCPNTFKSDQKIGTSSQTIVETSCWMHNHTCQLLRLSSTDSCGQKVKWKASYLR